MSEKVTRWRPDTCGCVVEYSWDSDAKEDEVDHSFHGIVEKCGAHTGIESDEEVFEIITQENRAKNVAIAKLAENVPRLKEGDGLDPAIECNWNFVGIDDERTLEIDFPNANLTKEETSKLEKSIASDDTTKIVTLG